MTDRADKIAVELLKRGVRCDHVMNMPSSSDKAYAFRLEFSAPIFAKRIRAYGDERAAEEASKLGFTEDNVDTASVVVQNIRNAALDEVAEYVERRGGEYERGLAAAIRALKEKP